MSESNLKPTRWYYLVALLIPFCACFGAGMFVVLSIPNLPGALEGMGINDLTQVRVPGSAEILFPKAGGYAVYYEYRSLLNGEKFAGGPYPPEIDCRLSSRSTGEEVEISSNFVEGNTYSTRNEERVGVLIKSITIQKPGSYIFSCHYPDGETSPKIVLAVGPNIVWEFFNVALKPISAIMVGSLAFISASAISLLIVVVVAYKRHQVKKRFHTDKMN